MCLTFDVLSEGAGVNALSATLCAHVAHVGMLVSQVLHDPVFEDQTDAVNTRNGFNVVVLQKVLVQRYPEMSNQLGQVWERPTITGTFVNPQKPQQAKFVMIKHN